MREVSAFADAIREAVFGANDGAVSTFGILSGLVGAGLSSGVIVLVGLVQMFAAGMSMGLGAYISTKSQNEYYDAVRADQREEIDSHPAREKKRVRHYLAQLGVKGKELSAAAADITEDKQHWTHFLVEERLGAAKERDPHPVVGGAVMFGAFVIAGLFPLLPFVFLSPRQGLVWSAVLALAALFAVGAAKTRFTHRNALLSGFENFLIGAVTGVVGFAVGSFAQVVL